MEQGVARSKRRPPVRTIKASEARQQWSQLLNSVFRGEARVVVEKSGIPVAAIVSAQDLKRLDRLDDRDARFAILDTIGEAFRDVPEEEIEQEVARAVAEARSRKRQGAVAAQHGVEADQDTLAHGAA